MRDVDCGFCYIKSNTELSLNGSCLAAEHDKQGVVIFTESAYGRCHQSALQEPLHWAYGFCPTDFAWMATFGLMLYLMFFAPGQSQLCYYLLVIMKIIECQITDNCQKSTLQQRRPRINRELNRTVFNNCWKTVSPARHSTMLEQHSGLIVALRIRGTNSW